jgi:hypothetical protein
VYLLMCVFFARGPSGDDAHCDDATCNSDGASTMLAEAQVQQGQPRRASQIC